MKIKELHIRNIASIEKADINFEQELIDAESGSPSSIFLIFGDTGTGKTVILDAIAMALYKKTPRIADVVNRQHNEFTDNEGQAVSIFSIEQYTRLGISEKDDCYSELVFESNDGCLYHAKLELGMVKGNKDANGNRPMKLRAPKWTYKVGNEDWQKVDPKGQVLVDAVGLSYEQFGRMAMLAQGQFAAFLTGDKTERESILEQLTNTSKFTVYGKAISNLFSEAKAQKTAAQTTYDTEKEHTLPTEEIQKLTEELTSLKEEKKALDETLNKENDRLKIVDDIEDFTIVRTQAEARKAELEVLAESEDYRQKKQLVNDWDATNHERQLLIDKQNAVKRKSVAEAQLCTARERFQLLSADLQYRDASLKEKQGEVLQLKNWMDERKAFDELFANVATINLQLEQYSSNTFKYKEAKLSLVQEKERTEQLLQEVSVCKKAEEQAKADVLAKQEDIDNLQKKRAALNPAGISKEKDAALNRKNELEKLQTQINKLEESRLAAKQTEKEIADESEHLNKLNETYLQSQNLFEQKAKEEEDARALLTTMQMSVEDTLTELRRKMHDNHAEVCPLCGQPIETLHWDEEFRHILTPLQQREEAAKSLLEAVTRQRDDDKTAYDKAKGALDIKTKEYGKIEEAIRKEGLAVKESAEKLSLTAEQDLLLQIRDSVNEEKDRSLRLDALLKQSEELQSAINRLVEEKKPLDEMAQKAQRKLSDANNAVEINRNKINDLEKNIAAFADDLDKLTTAISSQLSSYCQTWQDDIAATRQRLKSDAEEYLGKKKQAEQRLQEIGKIESLLQSLKSISDSILAKQTGWISSGEPSSYKTENINGEWTKLYALVEHQLEAINEAEKTQKDASESLTVYYASSGKTEQALLGIIGQEKEVADARKFVNGIDADLKSRRDAIADATKKVADLMQELKVEKTEDVPAKALLQSLVNELVCKQQILAGRVGGIEEKLKTNGENEKKLEEARQELEKANAKFGKWDRLNKCFGGTRFRTLVQTYILRPLLNNANIYLEKITDRYTLTCSEENEQLSILVLDRYNKNQVRSVTVLSGGERFMISLALSLALSSLNRQDMNVNILFIDEGFGTLDEMNLNSVMATLEKLQEIAGQSNRRVGIISHREELVDRIPVKINVRKKGEGRSIVEITIADS